MILGRSLRRLSLLGIALLLLVSFLALRATDRAGAEQVRCQQHRADARERARTVTGEGDTTLVIGDSWSVGLGQEDHARSWASRLPGAVHVAGFSGSGFSAHASTCGRVSFADRAPMALATHPDLVVVEGGLNDYDQPTPAIERGFGALMRDLAGQHVVVVGPASAPARSGAVPRVDALLSSLCRVYDVPYVATSDLDLPYLPDRLHLTGEGHDAFGEVVAERLGSVTATVPAVLTP